ncbi:DUF2971 domain-containing protein [[Empedobacter] haloabium]|uniref:DUF2971 domain-containing protein n=1 Tax=[Empedobacter] haloabium TaxID=592317 RepID=A0ABZ1UTC1_9BURK
MNSPASLPPSRIYKYFSFTSQNLENLKNQAIYFSSPKNFNDPYDCSVSPTIDVPSDEDVEGVRKQYLMEIPPGSPAHKQMLCATTEHLRQIFVKSAADTVAAKIKDFSERRGVSCFSESCNDLLMWAHYGGNYKGFCLEFESAYFAKLHKVNYSSTMPTFDPIPILRGEMEANDFMSVFSSKSPSWAYEKEWRALHANVGTLYSYPPQVLTGVYFGPEITKAALEIICLILQGQNETVKFWRGVKSTSEFKVEFDQIDYQSHLNAKRAAAEMPR